MAMTRAAVAAMPNGNGFNLLDEAPRLVGELDTDGTATLEVDSTRKNSASSEHISSELDDKALPGMANVWDLKTRNRGEVISDAASLNSSMSTSSEEDYDRLKYDPSTVIVGGKGGGLHTDAELAA